MRSRLGSLLFPEPPRNFPGRRALKIGLRGVHVVCASLCLGAYTFDANPMPWLVAAILTGLLVLALDVHESAAVLLQVRGAVVVAKVVVLAFLPSFGGAQAWVLGAIVLVSVVSSHAPSHVRHRVLLGRGRVRAAKTQG